MSKFYKSEYTKSFSSINGKPVVDNELLMEYDGNNHVIQARNKDKMFKKKFSNNFFNRVNNFMERNREVPFIERIVRIDDPLEYKRAKNPSKIYRVPTPYPSTRKRNNKKLKQEKKTRNRNRKLKRKKRKKQ